MSWQTNYKEIKKVLILDEKTRCQNYQKKRWYDGIGNVVMKLLIKSGIIDQCSALGTSSIGASSEHPKLH